MWRCDFSGYESVITLFEKEGRYSSEIQFTASHMKPKFEKLEKVDDKFLVVGSKVNEYYKVDEYDNLEMGDKKGLFTSAKNIMPGTEISELPALNIDDVIGQDIFFVAGMYSKSFAKTLPETNAKTWAVYYEDIDVTFQVDKSTSKIIEAKMR